MSKKTTRNAKGAGMIRKRSDGRWEGRYTVGFDPKTGKQVQKSIYAPSQKEVRQKLTQIVSEIDDARLVGIDDDVDGARAFVGQLEDLGEVTRHVDALGFGSRELPFAGEFFCRIGRRLCCFAASAGVA